MIRRSPIPAGSPPSASKAGAAAERRLQRLAADFRAAMDAGRFGAARLMAERALALAPRNPTVLGDYALCLMREGRLEAAYRVYHEIDALAPDKRQFVSPTWIDGMAEVCGRLGKLDELRQFGHASLAAADARYAPQRRWRVPEAPPPPFDPQRPARNVIAYSLFGSSPRYGEPLVMNAALVAELFPGWSCRVYLDDSVPGHVRTRLRKAGAQLVEIDARTRQAMPGTMWRFLVLDDPQVDRFMLRDADALLSEREAAAVAEWLQSGRWFHHMRDYCSHTELLLAGLWAGCRGVFPPIAPLMTAFAARHRDERRFTDQYFLRELLWPTIRDSVLNHDELFGFHDARPFPPHAPVRWQGAAFHVGSNASYRRIGGLSPLADGTRQGILLTVGGERLHYESPVRDGHWMLDLPFFLIDAFTKGTLRVDLLVSEGAAAA